MQTITPSLEAILKAKFQAGADGFRARVEVDVVTPASGVATRASRTAGGSVAGSGTRGVPMASLDFGAEAVWWAGEPTRLTVPTTGRYRVGGGLVQLAPGSPLILRVNGTDVIASVRVGDEGERQQVDTVETLVDLVAGDWVELCVDGIVTLIEDASAGPSAFVWAFPEAGDAARIRRTTVQTITTIVNTVVEFDTVEFDDASFWSAGDPGVLTIPADGTYRIAAHVPFGAATTFVQLAVKRNGTTFLATRRDHPGQFYSAETVSTEYRFTTGDEVTVDVIADSSGGTIDLDPDIYQGIVVTIARITETALRLRHTATQSVTSDTLTSVSWESERYDDGGYWTSGDQVSVPAGLHYVSASLGFVASGSNTSRSFYLRLNGTTVIAAYGRLDAPGSLARAMTTISVLWDFADGDYIEVLALQDSGAGIDLSVQDADACELAISTITDTTIAAAIITRYRQPLTVAIDKSLRMVADQAEVELANEGLALGWADQGLFPTNSRMRIFQWFGDEANEVLAFTGLIDRVHYHRDPLRTTVAARDLMAILLDQTFGATAPQGADEAGAVRTTANGVYLSMEVSAIVDDILDWAGWPVGDRAVSATSYVLDEYVIEDGWSWAEAILGPERLAGLVGYDAWADETGVFHFAPSFTAGALTDPPAPVYTFRAGEDITELDDETDQYDLRTRVKVRGPLTTQVLTDTWRELWRTRKFTRPVGIWYDPTDSGNIRVLDRGTKRLYKLRQSDRAILSSVNLGAVITYPLGVSGDPSDSTIYWVLNGPWLWGSGANSSIKKVRKSDNHVLATYTLDTDHWSSVKVSGSYIYVANLTDDRVYRRSKSTGAAVDSYRHTYSSVLQSNPSGLMIDGTTISTFWSNGGSTARFLISDESAPGTVTDRVRTTGTVLVGGEMDTTTHTECWGGSDSLGLVAKFTLVAVSSQTTEVYAEVVDTELEDELGSLAQMEPREHDTHPGDADHPFEIRRDTVDVTAVTSLAQATETAMRRLELLSRRREVLDAGIIGNPALQKTDAVRVEDPMTGSSRDWTVDTYRSAMSAGGTYLGTLALLPIEPVTDDPADDGDATE